LSFFDNRVIVFWSKTSKEKEFLEYLGMYEGELVGDVFVTCSEKVKINKVTQVKESWTWVYYPKNGLHSASKGFLCTYKGVKEKSRDMSLEAKAKVQELLEREYCIILDK
jgi:hypothetical protein